MSDVLSEVPAILNMAVFAENFQNYRRKIGPRGSETSKTHCETKLFARRWSIFRIAAEVQGYLTKLTMMW
jgi:hypothetical protein